MSRNNKKQLVVFANCQGPAVCAAMRQNVPGFDEAYEVRHLVNWTHLLNDDEPVPEEALRSADVLLYQPLQEKHGRYCTDNVLRFVRPECVRVSMPYIYFSALWPAYPAQGPAYVQYSPEPLVGSHSTFDVRERMARAGGGALALYRANALPFGLAERARTSLAILREKELHTDVKVADFVEANLRRLPLFDICNHPRPPVLVHCANQVLPRLGFEHIIPEDAVVKDYNDDKRWPICSAACAELGLTYGPEEGADAFYETMFMNLGFF